MNRKVPVQLFLKVMQYLAKRPFEEVYNLISMLNRCPEENEPKDADPRQAPEVGSND